MLSPEIKLDVDDIYAAPGFSRDLKCRQTQRFWVAEALRFTHKGAVDAIFAKDASSSCSHSPYPTFAFDNCLHPRKTPHFGLRPMLKNEGTVSGTYEVIDNIFISQFDLESGDAGFRERIQLVYGDQKTVSLIGSVKRGSFMDCTYKTNVHVYQMHLQMAGESRSPGIRQHIQNQQVQHASAPDHWNHQCFYHVQASIRLIFVHYLEP